MQKANERDQCDQSEDTPNKKRFFRDSRGDLDPGKVIPAFVVGVIAVIMAFAFLSEFYQVIEPVHEGLVVKGGELQEGTLQNGFYFKTPFWTDINSVYTGTRSTDDTAVEGEEGEFVEVSPYRGIRPLSKDGQELTMDVQLNYSIVDVRKFYTKTGSTLPQKIEQLYIIPKIRKYIKDIATEYGWKSLILEGERVEFSQRVSDAITYGKITKRVCEGAQKVIDEDTGIETIVEENCKLVEGESATLTPDDFGIIIESVNFKDIKPSPAIIAAIEKALAKEQEVKVASQLAEIAKANAQEQIEIKRGQTESQKLQAEADAYTIRVAKEEEAKGVMALAEAEKSRAAALAQSQQLVEYKKLDIEQIKAEALLEWARHPDRNVPQTITVIGTEEAESMKLLMGVPGLTVTE